MVLGVLTIRMLSNGPDLDLGAKSHDNSSMEIQGYVRNGVVVLDGETTFPEGTRVLVCPVPPRDQEPQQVKKLVDFPLVSSGEPGSIHLTNERIHEIFEEEDIESLKGS